MLKLLEPKEVIIDDHTYILSKFDCWTGREILTQYPITAVPKLGDYKSNEELALKMFAYVAVPRGDAEPLRLSTKDLVRNHVYSWETQMKIELAMIEYNCSFFQKEGASTSLGDTVQRFLSWIFKTWTALSAQSSQVEKQPLKS